MNKTTILNADKNGLPIVPTLIQVMRGTEKGHYYVIRLETQNFLLGFRYLDEDSSPGNAVNGREGRIRIVPCSTEEFTPPLLDCLNGLGFTRKRYDGEERAHFSVVTDRVADYMDAIAACVLVLDS